MGVAGRRERPLRRSTGSRTPIGCRSRPTTGCRRRRPAAVPASGAGSTTTSCPTPCSAGVCRVGRTVPPLVAPINAVSARALSERTLHRPVGQGLLHAAPGAVHRDGVRHAARRAAVDVLARCRRWSSGCRSRSQFPVEVRVAAADDIWLSHGYGRDSVYVAVHQSAGRARTSRTSARSRSWRAPLGRPAALGKAALPGRGLAAAGVPPVGRVPGRPRPARPRRVFANGYTEQVLGA